MSLNDKAENEAVDAKLRELGNRADQQPVSYKLLFDEAMEVAGAQFRRAMEAEARLFAMTAVSDEEGGELEPCPFCGSPGEIVKNDFPPRNPFHHPSCTNDKCVACVHEQDEQGGTHVDVLKREQAVALWNKRAALSAAPVEPELISGNTSEVIGTAGDYAILAGQANPSLMPKDFLTPEERRSLARFDALPEISDTDVADHAPVAQEPVAWNDALLAVCRTLKPRIFARGLHPLDGDGPVTRATIENTKHEARKILEALKHYTFPPATPAGVGADEIARFEPHLWKFVRKGESHPAQPDNLILATATIHVSDHLNAIQFHHRIQEAAEARRDFVLQAILALLSRAGDQSNSTHEEQSTQNI